MSQPCCFCSKPVNKHDVGAHREVRVWVTGPKSDGAKLREDTGRVACLVCITKLQSNTPPNTPDLFELLQEENNE